MISPATEADKAQITDITARAGVFSQEEIDSVPVMFEEYLEYGTEGDGYHFFVHREGEQLGVKYCHGSIYPSGNRRWFETAWRTCTR